MSETSYERPDRLLGLAQEIPIWLGSCQPCAVSTSAFVDANESRLLDHMILDLIEKLTAV